ncbi:MAG: RHS repeat-associated core domain-containing protein, partial [Bacteroidota bacterium]
MGGNRVTKVVKEDATEETWKYTYYITDFDGNHLLTLSRDFQPSGNVSNPQITIPTGTAYVEQLTIDAHEVYGSSRLGISYDGRLLSAQGYDNLSHDSQGYLDKSTSSSLSILPQSATLGLAFTRGKKRYELSEHRGNVMVTLSDRRAYTFSMDNFGNPIVEVIPDVRMATDYYPFGKEMHGRKLSLGEYRYGFQGQEGDQETGFWNYKYRMHSPDLGRFFSVDPLAPKYPWNSPYAFSENRLIDAVELEGLEANVIGEITGWLEMKHQQGIIYYELGEKVGLSPREKAFAYLAPYWFGDDGIYQFTPGPSLEVLMNSSQASGYEIGLAVFEFA